MNGKPNLWALHAQQIRDSWQGRVLAKARGHTGAVVMVILTHALQDQIKILLRAVYPDFRDIKKPFYCSTATITRRGRIVCDMIDKDGACVSGMPVYADEGDFLYEMRQLADSLKLSDRDRKQFFVAARAWIARDDRVNQFGEKVLS